jgi:ABC-type phosphate transport system substrate-binding protein
MPRMSMRTRGIVLAPFAVLLIAACTPPMPPDVLAARAESQIVCDSGTLEVAVPETFLGSMTAAGDALTSICPEQLIAEVADDQAAAMAVVDRTPTPTDITAFGAANCPVGVPIVVPAFGYPVSMAYNVPGLEGLVMTPDAVAGILTGTVVSWDDPLLAEANPDFDLSSLPPISLMSVEGPQGSVEAMTAWTSAFAPDSWSAGTTGVIDAGTKLPTVADLISELTVTEGAIAVLPIFQALNNVLAIANLPVIVTDEDGGTSEVIVTSDDVQLYKVGSGATSITTDDAGNILASPAIGGVPTEGNFDIASSKIVLGEDQALVGWPVIGYSHLLICDDPANTLALSFAQYVVRLAGQGSLETFGLTPLPEPIRVKTFIPLKVTVSTGEGSATPSS